jgi:hypothetical protein
LYDRKTTEQVNFILFKAKIRKSFWLKKDRYFEREKLFFFSSSLLVFLFSKRKSVCWPLLPKRISLGQFVLEVSQ